MRAEWPAPRARPGEHARGRHFSFAKELSNAMDWVFLCQVLFPVFFAAGLLLAGAYCAGHIKPYAFSALRALHRWEPYLAAAAFACAGLCYTCALLAA